MASRACVSLHLNSYPPTAPKPPLAPKAGVDVGAPKGEAGCAHTGKTCQLKKGGDTLNQLRAGV